MSLVGVLGLSGLLSGAQMMGESKWAGLDDHTEIENPAGQGRWSFPKLSQSQSMTE
jgi:hypothetical protein